MRVRVAAVIVLGVLVLGLLVFLVGGTVVAVATGEVAVLVNPFESDPGRRIALGPIGPIWAIGAKAPWVDILHVRISTQTVLMAPPEAIAGQFADILTPAIVVLSKDGLNIEVDLNMRYAILPSKTVELYQRYPKFDYGSQIIQITREAVRNVIAEFKAVEVIEKRGILDTPIKDAVTKKIRDDPSLSNAIDVIGLEVLRILPPSNFLESINSKLRAEQEAAAADFRRQTAIINADAERQQSVLRAQGFAQAKLIEANATQQAILTVVQSLGGSESEAARLYLTLLMYREIAQSGGQILIIPESRGQFLIQLPTNATSTNQPP